MFLPFWNYCKIYACMLYIEFLCAENVCRNDPICHVCASVREQHASRSRFAGLSLWLTYVDVDQPGARTWYQKTNGWRQGMGLKPTRLNRRSPLPHQNSMYSTIAQLGPYRQNMLYSIEGYARQIVERND